MRILVTGAAGFIGSHVTRALLADGHDVWGFDDLSTGYRRNLPEGALRWTFVLGDVRDVAACEVAMRGMTAVVHLAARNSVPRSIADPRSALDVNVVGGFNLLEAARSAGVERFVFASSSSVYGNDPTLPKVESQRCQPLSPYAASKASFESLAGASAASWGLHTVGLRLFNVFGPRQEATGAYAAVMPRFVGAALRREIPLIYGDGSATRDFTFVDNVVYAFRLALDAPKGSAGAVLNVGCGGRIGVLELWRLVAREAGFDAEPRFAPLRVGDMAHSQADIGEARRVLGFEPIVSIEEGVRRTVSWFRTNGIGVSS